MNLNEYFKSQNCKLCDEKKLLIYDEIKNHITKESIFTRFSFYTKVGVYSLILLFLFTGLFFNFKTNISNNVELSQNSSTVYADYIGKIIQSKGQVEVYDDNKLVDTSMIKNGNTIILKNNSYIKLVINNGINTYLLGPAKIKINKTNNNTYILNVFDGDYLTLKSNNPEDKIIIKSKLINIESNDNNIDIKYEDKNGVSIIENNGGNIIVKNKENTLKLDKNEKLIVLNDEDKKYIENLFSDDYKKYQISNGKIKTILPGSEIKRIDTILNKKFVILTVGEYVLGTVNHNKELEKFGKSQLYNMLLSMYNILGEKIPQKDLEVVNNNTIRNLASNLLDQINKKYILPNDYVLRLKVILSYVVILDKVSIPENKKFTTLSEFVNYLKIDNKYKKILLSF